jgi:hypothetical protein
MSKKRYDFPMLKLDWSRAKVFRLGKRKLLIPWSNRINRYFYEIYSNKIDFKKYKDL